jgi:hypothetical protein
MEESALNLVGLKLFVHLNEAGFRKVVLLLLLASGVTLVL